MHNDTLLADLLEQQLPGAVYHRPQASYLGCIDLRAFALGANPAALLTDSARLALTSGHGFGPSD